ncbi:MAG: methyltransferase domain-containing protein, partial [Elusimicrobia bacterium]|nr:methyltransferase domain-containing protein [Elusimicrobiota bacterium]
MRPTPRLALAAALFAALPAGAQPAPRGPSRALEALAPSLYDSQPFLACLRVDARGRWKARAFSSGRELEALEPPCRGRGALLIPLFPTVFAPGQPGDAVYYDYILEGSGLRKGDKVLVVGPGSGADAWAAWLRTGALVYAVDVNPLAVANTRATAQLAGFPVDAVQGDISRMDLPEGFSGFDCVLWNMPFVNLRPNANPYARYEFHDGDDGRVLAGFLKRLPALLKKGGKAVIL